MSRRRSVAGVAVAAGLAVASLPAPAPAAPAGPAVDVQFQAFSPDPLDVLPGETVTWTNVSERRHTVDADDGSFSSGDLFGGDTYTQTYSTVGPHPYHCTVHPGMTGEVDVRRVTLGSVPTAPIPVGTKVEFEGRTADPGLPVAVQRIDGSGAASETVGTATPAADGTWTMEAAVTRTGDYRASTTAGASESRRLLVSDRRVILRATRAGVAVTVTPSVPYGRIALQLDLPERFGWWPQVRTRLDYVSEATFRVPRPARVRVAFLDRDGWTPLAVSRVLVLPRAGPRRSTRGRA
jgi:plastocyanin